MVLTNAAREGARQAILIDKTDADVQATVQNYMKAGGLPKYATAAVVIERNVALGTNTASKITVNYPFNFMVLTGSLLARRAAPPANRSPCSLSRSCGTKARNSQCVTESLPVLAIAILAGGGLAYGTYNLVQNQPAKTAASRTQPVVVAAADLQLGAELKKEDLTVVNFPAGQAPEGTFSQPTDLIGRGLIVSVVKNEPILTGKLASKEAGAGLPPVIPEGMRAVSVRVNEVIGVAGYVLPGTRVDVVATAPDDVASRHDLEADPLERAGAHRRHAHGAGPGEGQAGAGDGRHRWLTPSSPSAWRWRAPKARFSWRCATRWIRARPRPRASRPRPSSAWPAPRRLAGGRLVFPAALGEVRGAGDPGDAGARAGADRGSDPRDKRAQEVIKLAISCFQSRNHNNDFGIHDSATPLAARHERKARHRGTCRGDHRHPRCRAPGAAACSDVRSASAAAPPAARSLRRMRRPTSTCWSAVRRC